MRLTANNLEERARWLIAIRWIACLSVLVVIWVLSSRSSLISDPRPLFAVAIAMVAYNLLFETIYRGRKRVREARRNGRLLIVFQINLDLISLTLLLYFAGLPLNPFILYYVFHIIIASILLPGWVPYSLALLATCLVGSILFLQEYRLIPVHPLAFSWLVLQHGHGTFGVYSLYTWGVMIALASTLGIGLLHNHDLSVPRKGARTDPAAAEDARHRPTRCRLRPSGQQSSGRSPKWTASDWSRDPG